MTILPEPEWQARRVAHETRVRPWVDPRLTRASIGKRHPVEDFLFEYYPYRPGQLLRWHPGVGVALEGGSAREFLMMKPYVEENAVVYAGNIPQKRGIFVRWVRTLLTAIQNRCGSFGCYGLHEWAMVYRTNIVRHAGWPLRLTPSEIEQVVESLPIRCSHYDAFRFFTPAARPLNRLQPARSTVLNFEQPGCLHANMDLYKWAFKLAPFTPSELVADAFELARAIRILDMRASPYDLSSLDYEPVRIETEEGRAEYEGAQGAFAARAAVIRERLIKVCDDILLSLSSTARVTS